MVGRWRRCMRHGNSVVEWVKEMSIHFWGFVGTFSGMTNLTVRTAGVLGLACATAVLPCVAQNSLSTATANQIDAAAKKVLEKSGVPSASVAVVQDGKIAYV